MNSLLPIALMIFASMLPSQTAPTQPAQTQPAGLPNPFFALDTATKDANHQSYDSQVRMLKELGYAGWGSSAKENVPEMLKALDAHGLKMFAIYVVTNVDPDQPKYDPNVREAIASLRGRDTFVWLCILGTRLTPASQEGDKRAVAIIDEIAEMAEQAGVRVALYPHVNFYLARVEDAVRLVGKVRHRNVGVTFNLCHWLKTDRQKDPDAVLRLARPHLVLVTINGADFEGEWDRLIQPLGRGEFDVYGLLKMLRKMGYDGPIGFQGYGIKGDVHQNLKETMNAWRAYSERCVKDGL
ncbi:MAG: sugar phosphate isomerase/epimerase family protein [Phycisphaerae bacterium]